MHRELTKGSSIPGKAFEHEFRSQIKVGTFNSHGDAAETTHVVSAQGSTVLDAQEYRGSNDMPSLVLGTLQRRQPPVLAERNHFRDHSPLGWPKRNEATASATVSAGHPILLRKELY